MIKKRQLHFLKKVGDPINQRIQNYLVEDEMYHRKEVESEVLKKSLNNNLIFII